MSPGDRDPNRPAGNRTAPVSVVIPCYCCTDTVPRAVASVVEQTLPPEEIILVDDGSPDGGRTFAALQDLTGRYAGRVRLSVLRMPANAGPSAARNRGWQTATQPYVAFLDADDAWHPRKLELQVGWMEAHPEIMLTGTRSVVVDSVEHLPAVREPPQARELRRADLLLANPLPTRSVVLRTGLPLRFVAEKRHSEDYLLWVSILLSGHRVALIDAILSCSFKRDFGASGLSSHLWQMQCEVLDSYRRLHAYGYIGAGTRFALGAMSWGKFVRRVTVTACGRALARRRPEQPVEREVS